MSKKLLVLILLSLPAFSGYSQIWVKTDGRDIPASEKLERTSFPSSFTLYHLDLNALKAQLQNAPQRSSGAVSALVLPFPDGNGQLQQYRIYEAPVMEPALAVQHPDMKSYVGQNIIHPSETIRFSTTLFGLYTMTLSANGTAYTDPYTKDRKTYMVYKKAGLTTSDTFNCGVTEDMMHYASRSGEPPLTTTSDDGILRVYRLAMACTIEYAAFHVNEAGLNGGTLQQKKDAVLAAMVTTVTRVDEVYETDFSITMQLVAGNEDIIFIDSDDFDNNNTDNILLDQSQQVIDANIGFDNYDIGHTVSTGGGGVAQLWSPCSDSKAKGITGLPSPVGDPFDIDYVAHEMGHQFGGNHSFNNDCGGNRNDATAYEPGSGSTIMGYAGVCDPNVQPHSDAMFQANSIAEMSYFIKTAGDCGVHNVTGNLPPVANAGPDYTIPKGTAFILSGTATDENQEGLTYNWEEMDNEISVQPPSPDSDSGPNFRSLPSKDVPQRYMPDLEDVINNNLTPTWEVVSNVAREYNFAFTVRDNDIQGGLVTTDMMKVEVSGTAGPFVVTSPNTGIAWQAGTNQNVTWNVAGTTQNGVNTPYVDILLSTDGGHTYPVVLGAKVPNDGSEVVTVPNLTGNSNRVMVRGYNNIFYDISNTNFTITAPTATMAIAATGDQNITACKGSDVEYHLAYNAYAGFSGTTTFSVTGNPDGSTVTFSPNSITANGNITVTVADTGNAAPGFYTLNVTAMSGTVVKNFNLYLDLLNSDFGSIALQSPAQDATAVPAQALLSWSASENATSYELEIATDEGFSTIVAALSVTGTSYQASLSESTQYYWRVKPENEGCAGNESAAGHFTTGQTQCTDSMSADIPVAISETEPVTVTSQLTVSDDTPIEKLSVNIDITHTWVGDLTVTLTSPQGTSVQLFSEDCWDSHNVNAVFDDDGIASVCGTDPALSGTILPDEPLAAFNGESPEGVWTLTVVDEFGADGGSLNNWGVTICSVQEAPAAVQDNTFNDFSLFPNPNKGDFTLRFSSATGNDINVSIYDMRGRKVLDKTIANTGLIEQNIALGAAEAGMYLVQVRDGGRSITKKIIVN